MSGAGSRISLRDESDLTWFFIHGETQFSRSTHDAMARRIERDSAGSIRCPICGGGGILETAEHVRKHKERYKPPPDEERRSVWVYKKTGIWVDFRTVRNPAARKLLEEQGKIQEQALDQVIGAECQVCMGTGHIDVPLRRPRCSDPETDEGCWGGGRRARVGCSLCLGTGTPALDAQPTHHERDEIGVEPDGDVLRRFARVSKRLLGVPVEHRLALERFYGIHGQSWADQPGGRLLALHEFTKAGRRLLRRTKLKGDEATGASPAERIAAQIDLQSRKPQKWRQECLQAATEEASKALTAAAEAWSKTAQMGNWAIELEELYEAADATGDAYEAWLDRNWLAWWFDPCTGPEPETEKAEAAE